jgi:hypothetical protein
MPTTQQARPDEAGHTQQLVPGGQPPKVELAKQSTDNDARESYSPTTIANELRQSSPSETEHSGDVVGAEGQRPQPPEADSSASAMRVGKRHAINAAKNFSSQASRAAVDLLAEALSSLKMNTKINTVARAFFYLIAVASLAAAVYFVFTRFDSFVNLIQGSANAVDNAELWRLIAIGVPVLLASLNVLVCVSVAILIQNRSNTEYSRSIAQASRLMRESPLVPGRSLALTQILEETLANAKQAFKIQLWISKLLFAAGVLLLFVFVGSLFFSSALASGGAAVTSLLAFVAAALLNPQRQIRTDLATVTQLAAILAGYTRQAAIIEEHLYGIMSDKPETPEEIDSNVYLGVEKLDLVLRSAMRSISEHVEGPDKTSPREVWLWQQLALQQESATTKKAEAQDLA